MGKVIAERLKAEVDVELVYKFGFPANPEFALESVAEEFFLGSSAERYGLAASVVPEVSFSRHARNDPAKLHPLAELLRIEPRSDAR